MTLATLEPQLILASASPRRAELLRQIAVHFTQVSVDVDESPLLLSGGGLEAPEAYVSRLALLKAQCGQLQNIQSSNAEPVPVLGSDTCVVVDNDILGKPRDDTDAKNLLQRLSGQVHQVMTGVAVVKDQIAVSALSITEVEFRRLSASEIQRYVDSGEPNDKAGAYAIQGFAAVFIKKITGSYSGVMGLPLAETYQLLKQMGVIVDE